MKALITGASSGIGRDIAHVLSSKGYSLILVARNQERLLQLQKTLQTPSTVIPLDLSIPEHCFMLYQKVKKEKIEVLINNAGYGIFGEFLKTDLEQELNLIDLNIKAVHILTKLFLKDFVAQDRGFILNVSSSAAFLPGPLLSSYYASKAYVLRLTEAVDAELKKRGSKVSVSALCPGPVQTNFDERAGVSFSLPGLSSSQVASYAVKKMFQKKRIIIPGGLMKLSYGLEKIAPESILTQAAYHIQHKKER